MGFKGTMRLLQPSRGRRREGKDFTRETVIVARHKQIQVWETTTDTDAILIVVESQPPSTGILGMSHREQ